MTTQDTPGSGLARRSPKVLVVGARGIPDVEGGCEKNAERLFPLIVAEGYDVTLVGLQGLIKGSEYKGVKLIVAPNRRVLNTDKLFYYLYAVRLAWEQRPDIVHLQGLGASLFLWAYKLAGAKVVVRYGSADYILDKWGAIGRAGFRAAEFQMRAADAVIAVAPALVERLKKNGISKNVHLVGNAIDGFSGSVPSKAQTKADSPYFLLVGRVTSQKNVANIISAFRTFKQQSGSSHRLLIAGGLEDEGYVASLQSSLSSDVVLLGRQNRDQLDELYAGCDAFINGSVHEGASNAVLEAIGRSCSLLISNIPENRDFHLPELCYFPPLEPSELAAKMHLAVANPQAFVVDQSSFLSWDDVCRKTLEVYRQVMA